MHIRLDENPIRRIACKSSPSMPYVSLETIAKFSNLDMTATRRWVRVNKVPVHVCRRVTYVAAARHSGRQRDPEFEGRRVAPARPERPVSHHGRHQRVLLATPD